MPEAEMGKAVRVLDLLLEYFGDRGEHWTRDRYDDGGGRRCPVGYATSVEAFADAWFGQNYQLIRRSLRRGAIGPYPLPNCEECMSSFAPKAAEGRHAVRYSAGIPPSADSLEFTAAGDLRIEGIGRDTGHCYLSDRLPPGIVPDFFDLWEDERLLGPGAASTEEIRMIGAGRYLITGRSIYWATSGQYRSPPQFSLLCAASESAKSTDHRHNYCCPVSYH
jgi:hypothetical protein